MPRRENTLFIGAEHMALEGRTTKHPALIVHNANPNVGKINDEPIDIAAMDLETNHVTGELRLLGFYTREKGYAYYVSSFNAHLFSWVRFCYNKNLSLAYWNRLDPFVLLRTMLKGQSQDTINQALSRFSKVSGEWSKKEKEWTVQPVLEIEMGKHRFGIKQAIRSSIQFYFLDEEDMMRTVWAYDIAQLYKSSLERECLGKLDEKTNTYPNARFPWYSKVDKSSHLVDWERFAKDKQYKKDIVLRSNELDAKACCELAYSIQDDFKTAFKWYPRTLISQGSLARAAIIASITNRLQETILDEKELKKAVYKEVYSIGIDSHIQIWAEKHDKDHVKDLYALACEAYSGGYIEAIRYGTCDSGWHADIASAYPAVIKDLYDLRGSTIEKGTGEPPKPKQSYVFIRGDVTIPDTVQFHTITVKSPFDRSKDTNVRPVGSFRASYTYNERAFLVTQGATFKDEEWYHIKTKGKRSVLANVCREFIDLRTKLNKEKNSAEHMAKIAANSMYGILYEAVDTHKDVMVKKTFTEKYKNEYKEILRPYFNKMNIDSIKKGLKHVLDKDFHKFTARWKAPSGGMTPDVIAMELAEQGIMIEHDNAEDIALAIDELYSHDDYSKDVEIEMPDVVRAGYRSGEFWNPIYAAIITSECRLQMAKAAATIEERGGKVIVMMTDSITWQGSWDQLPSNMVRREKTLGYFEFPQLVKNIVCLGTGRYGFETADGTIVAKRRGLNAVDIHDENGHVLDTFNWALVLEQMVKQNKATIDIAVRTLISVGMVAARPATLGIDHLGRVVEEVRNIEVIVGGSKRFIDKNTHNPVILSKSLLPTRSLVLDHYMLPNQRMDQTLWRLREAMMARPLETQREVRKRKNKGYARDYYKTHQDDIVTQKQINYHYLRENGIDVETARTMSSASKQNIDRVIYENRRKSK